MSLKTSIWQAGACHPIHTQAGTWEREFWHLMIAYEKILHFKGHISMYVIDPTYENVVIFLCGMDYHSNGEMLRSFEGWLRKKFDIESPFYWGKLISFIYQKIRTKDDSFVDKGELEFLFDVIQEFLQNDDVLVRPTK